MHFRPNPANPPPEITIGESQLGIVYEYKYLGFYVTNSLDSTIQWLHIQTHINKNIYLLKQLAHIGLNIKILVNIFKSLVLSLLRYSSIVLVSCTSRIRSDIQVMQNTLLGVIGLPRAVVKINHNIIDANDFILNSCLQQINRILSLPTHPLTVSLHSSTITHSPLPFKSLDGTHIASS